MLQNRWLLQDIMLSETNQKSTTVVWFCLYEITAVVKFIKTEGRVVVCSENREMLFNGDRISVFQAEEF